MSSQTDPQADREPIGETLYEARFDPLIASHGRVVGTLFFISMVVTIPFIPLLWLLSLWYYPEYLRRISARLTTHAVEIRKGVIFRKESTIPLNRITDVRLHDGPIMRYYNLRGLRLETAGQAGQGASSEGNLLGVIDAVEFRDRILRQRQKALGTGDAPAPAAAPPELLTEIRDILARIETQGPRPAG